MFDNVTVTASARLHLGFLDMNGGLGRRFGSLGLAIDRPVTRLRLQRAAALTVEGLEAERASHYLTDLARHLGLPLAYALTIENAIPPHAGLGSGTQLALAVATALRRLEGFLQTRQTMRCCCGAAPVRASAWASSNKEGLLSMADMGHGLRRRRSSPAWNFPPNGG